MLFNSPLFLFAFLPACLLVYWLSPRRFQNAALLAFSLGFYAWTEPRFVLIAAASSLFDFLAARRVFHARGSPEARGWLAAGVATNIGMLAYFKYADFFLASLNQAAGAIGVAPFKLLHVALPVAISFIVFEKITYLVDIHRGTGAPARKLSDYLLYVFFFPKLMAGPIIKHHDIQNQIESRISRWDDVWEGMGRFAMGMGKKVLIADTVAPLADEVFGMPAAGLGAGHAWLGVVAFSVQIYYDFSGYSDMAIGLGRIFGFRLLENFNSPYLARNFTEFWRRWHISLSTWIRDYLYIPLGGSRGSTARTYLNLWVCFLASGLWHGANWTFMLWGAFHGCVLVLEKLFYLETQKRLPTWVNHATTLLLIMAGWVVFRVESLGQLADFAPALVRFKAGEPGLERLTGETVTALLAGAAICFVPPASEPSRRGPLAWRAAAACGVALLLLAALSKMAMTNLQSFLYFRF